LDAKEAMKLVKERKASLTGAWEHTDLQDISRVKKELKQ
jgi:hypothetical protein